MLTKREVSCMPLEERILRRLCRRLEKQRRTMRRTKYPMPSYKEGWENALTYAIAAVREEMKNLECR